MLERGIDCVVCCSDIVEEDIINNVAKRVTKKVVRKITKKMIKKVIKKIAKKRNSGGFIVVFFILIVFALK
jgi:anaerobic ribonucleoside-triphosphate reductase